MWCLCPVKAPKMWAADFQRDPGKTGAGQIRRQIGCFSLSLSLSLIEEFKFSEISHSQALSGGVCWATLYSLPYETSFD